MKLQDIILSSFQSLDERKFRLALNVLGILIGVAAVTGLISITDGLSVEITSQLDMFGSTNIMVIPFEIRRGRGLIGEGFNWRDVQQIEKIKNIKYIAPVIANKFATFNYKGITYRANVFGTTSTYFQIFQAFEIVEGRGLVQADKSSIVIGHLISQPTGQDEPIYDAGDRIKLQFYVKGEEKEMVFRVVGILKEVGGAMGSEDDNSILMPYRTAQQIFEVGGTVDFVAVQVNKMENIDLVSDEIKETFDDNVMVMSSEMLQEQINRVLGTIEAVLGGIAAISLLVAGVGIINTMTISVMERTQEIGVLKALGSKSTEILFMFLTEATITGLIGGVLGALLGFAMGALAGNYIGLTASRSPTLGALVVAFAIITSVLAGIYPSWRASSLNPVDALRYE